MKYDYLIVGAGLYGAVFAREMTRRGKRCLVIDRRAHIAGNVYTEGNQLKMFTASTCINTALIFFTPATKRFGIM